MRGNASRNFEIEALRGVAILFVLYSHVGHYLFFGYPEVYGASRELLQTGTGVDLFFCISGFVITKSFLTRRSQPAFAAVAVPFWIRRFWRLAPSAWLWLAVNLLLALAFGDSANTTFSTMFLPNLRDSLAAILQVANFHVYECVNQINAAQCGNAYIYWSLSLEEQFYLVFPFLMLFLSRRMLIATLAVIALAQIFLPRNFAGLLWLVRTDAISLGALIALAQESSSYRLLAPSFLSTALQRWLAFVVLCTLLATIDAPKIHFVEFATGLIAIVSGIIVWLASFNEGYGITAGNVRKALTYIGARSYALYLCHEPIAWLVVHTLRRLPASVTGLVALITIFLAAEISYRYVETPLRRRGREIAYLVRMKLETTQAPVLAPGPD